MNLSEALAIVAIVVLGVVGGMLWAAYHPLRVEQGSWMVWDPRVVDREIIGTLYHEDAKRGQFIVDGCVDLRADKLVTLPDPDGDLHTYFWTWHGAQPIDSLATKVCHAVLFRKHYL